MIYYFGTGTQVSMIANEKYLTEEQRSQASLIVESETTPEIREGFIAVRTINDITKEFSWTYIEKSVDVLRIEKLQKLVDSGTLTQEEMNELL